MLPPRREAALAGVVCCGALLAALHPLLFGQVPFYRDVLLTSLPLREYAAARLRAGALPQWFPWESLGEPFLGQLNEAALHPATLLYVALPRLGALRLDLALAYACALGGLFVAARAAGTSRPGASTGAVAYALSGYAASLSSNLAYLWGFAALPWMAAAAAHLTASDVPWRATAWLALATGAALLAGDAHAPLLGGIACVALVLASGKPRKLGWVLLGLALGAGIAAAELVPSLGVAAESNRARWTNAAFLSRYWALHPHRLLELFVPDAFPRWVGELFAQRRYGEPGRWAESVFAGSAAVALALAGLKRRGPALAAAALAVIGLWLAAGSHGGLELLLRSAVPPLRVLRFPEKHLALFCLGIALLAAFGADRLAATRRAWLAVGSAGGACAILALVVPGEGSTLWRALYAGGLAGDGIARDARVALSAAWRTGLLLDATILALAAAVAGLAARRPAIAWLLPALVAVELRAGSRGALVFVEGAALEGLPATCDAARRAGGGPAGLRVFAAPEHPPAYSGPGDAGTWVRQAREALQPDSNAACEIAARSTYSNLPGEPDAVQRLLGGERAPSPLLGLYSFGLAVRDGPAGSYRVVQLPAAARAFAGVPRWARDEKEAEDLVRADPDRAVASPVLVGAGTPEPPAGSAGTVRISLAAPERVVLEASLWRPAAVVLNDGISPGWSATIDGVPAPLYRANLVVRAVLAPAGSHRIEMTYALPGLRAGVAISVLALLGCLALAFAARLRRPPPLNGGRGAVLPVGSGGSTVPPPCPPSTRPSP